MTVGMIEIWMAICLSVISIIMVCGIPWAYTQNGRLSGIETAVKFLTKGITELRDDNPPPEVKQALKANTKQIEDLWEAVNKLRDASPANPSSPAAG